VPVPRLCCRRLSDGEAAASEHALRFVAADADLVCGMICAFVSSGASGMAGSVPCRPGRAFGLMEGPMDSLGTAAGSAGGAAVSGRGDEGGPGGASGRPRDEDGGPADPGDAALLLHATPNTPSQGIASSGAVVLVRSGSDERPLGGSLKGAASDGGAEQAGGAADIAARGASGVGSKATAIVPAVHADADVPRASTGALEASLAGGGGGQSPACRGVGAKVAGDDPAGVSVGGSAEPVGGLRAAADAPEAPGLGPPAAQSLHPAMHQRAERRALMAEHVSRPV
jgi:hypothetical protein